MKVWRVETTDGKGPFLYDMGSTFNHRGDFPAPRKDAYETMLSNRLTRGLYEWIYHEFSNDWARMQCEGRNPHAANLYCALVSPERLAEAFDVSDRRAATVFQVVVYDVPPLYVIILERQVLFDKRYAVECRRIDFDRFRFAYTS